jgi:hypothetical protein
MTCCVLLAEQPYPILFYIYIIPFIIWLLLSLAKLGANIRKDLGKSKGTCFYLVLARSNVFVLVLSLSGEASYGGGGLQS